MLQSVANCAAVVSLVILVFLEDDCPHEATWGAAACEEFELGKPLLG
jgi:hypothetical protein